MGSTVTPSSHRSRRGTEPVPVTQPGRDGPSEALLQQIQAAAGPDLARAAAAVVALPPAGMQLPEDGIEHHLRWVILEAGTGTATDCRAETGAVIALRRRLIAALRAALVEDWSANPPAGAACDLVSPLEMLERAQRACMPGADQALATELADTGGLDLVVEVAHDMRSPLTSILFLSEILHKGQSGSFNEAQKRQIGIIYSAALGLIGLASDMIELARGGSLSAREPVPFSVNEVLQSVRDLVRPTAEEKNLTLAVGSIDAEHRLGHPVPLNRVLLNLTTNALKFTQRGGVDITAEPAGASRVRFAVRDTGPGISPAAMATLFQPFRREPARESGYSFSGTGLGLSICRKLVRAMGSELEVESVPDGGTSFSFVIDLPPARMF